MKVILLEQITRLGNMGQVVEVKPGYARNFLLPREKAMRATQENLAVFEARRADIEARNAELRGEAQAKSKELEGLTLTLARASSDEGKLFGSITVRDIAEALEEKGFDVPKSVIHIGENIKYTGEYTVKLRFHADVETSVALHVVRNELQAA